MLFVAAPLYFFIPLIFTLSRGHMVRSVQGFSERGKL